MLMVLGCTIVKLMHFIDLISFEADVTVVT